MKFPFLPNVLDFEFLNWYECVCGTKQAQYSLVAVLPDLLGWSSWETPDSSRVHWEFWPSEGTARHIAESEDPALGYSYGGWQTGEKKLVCVSETERLRSSSGSTTMSWMFMLHDDLVDRLYLLTWTKIDSVIQVVQCLAKIFTPLDNIVLQPRM